MSLAPVLLFTYNRPHHFKRCIESLKKNKLFLNTNFFIFQDKLKETNIDINAKYESIIKNLPKNFTLIKRKKNFGLKKNIIKGVSLILKKFKKVIVCEDDLIFHKDFIFFMNDNLTKYEKIKKISSVSGFSPILKKQKKLFSNNFLLSLTSSWGWGTWRSHWDQFININLQHEKKFFFKDKILQYKFDYEGAQSHTLWLKKNQKKLISSWNIEWEFFNFINDYLTFYPKITLVENKGFDSSGAHCKFDYYNFQKINNNYQYSKNIPLLSDFFENEQHRKIIASNINEGFLKKNIKKILYFYL
jgi:hypothetical protein